MQQTASPHEIERQDAGSERAYTLIHHLREHIERSIIGQQPLLDGLLTGILAGGHMLIEGMPGLAKTRAVNALASGVSADFKRVQFTPDLLPSDITGTEIFTRETGAFTFREGPLFNHIILADEINRAPAKVQAALLEAMEEHQITVGLKSYPLPELFTVLATQNPIEQEGTYGLPEAQLDRFMLHISVDYPTYEEELRIINLVTEPQNSDAVSNGNHTASATIKDILTARDYVSKMFVHERLKEYAAALICATRTPGSFDADLKEWLACGVSPRATIALIKAAKAYAFLQHAPHVTPEHVRHVAPSVLRHRIIPTFSAEADSVTRDDIVNRLLSVVAAP